MKAASTQFAHPRRLVFSFFILANSNFFLSYFLSPLKCIFFCPRIDLQTPMAAENPIQWLEHVCCVVAAMTNYQSP